MVISHSHYDHLCSASVAALRAAFGDGGAKAAPSAAAAASSSPATSPSRPLHWYVPLGLAAWFHAAGVAAEHVTELDWWQEAQHGKVRRESCKGERRCGAPPPSFRLTPRPSASHHRCAWCARRRSTGASARRGTR